MRLPLAALLAAVVCGPAATGEARVETIAVKTSAPENRNLQFAVRLPRAFSPARARILVTFGGRNWDARRTLATYRFDDFADKHNLVIVAPGFVNDDYWNPEKWSGAALEEALARIRRTHRIPDAPRLYYGYSAGGQCANLFYTWKPEKVLAWAAHACGVWFKPEEKRIRSLAPALVTCGVEDVDRYRLSREFAFSYREAGGELVWRDYDSGHALTPEALALAQEFFASVLDGAPPFLVADDDTGQVYPANSHQAERVPVELRSVFRTQAFADLWQRQTKGE
jgi:poly(3-hydroxybutyrate) depolymerase